MSDIKYTPGPLFTQREGVSTMFMVSPVSDHQICTASYCTEADATLYAAAPELLEALQGAIGALEFSQDFHRDLGNEEQAFAADKLDAARAAIAKALGEGQ